jgi:PAS domain S-box-containing protein
MTLDAAVEHDLLEAAFALAPVGVAFFDAELRCLRANDALATMVGVPAGEQTGRTPSELRPDAGRRLEELLRLTLDSGRARRDAEITTRCPWDPGTTQHWVASAYPIPGEAARVGVVVTDISHRKRIEKEHRRLLLLAREAQGRAEQAERRAAFLASAGKLLAESLDHGETLERVAQLAVPELAEFCFVEIVCDDGSIQRLAWAADDPEKEEIAARYVATYPLDPASPVGSARVIRTGEPERADDVPAELLAILGEDDERLRLFERMGFGASMIVPLRARGRILGAIALIASESGRRFDLEDLNLAQELADRCALAVDNARLYAQRS